MTSNVSQAYPYSCETEAERAAAVAADPRRPRGPRRPPSPPRRRRSTTRPLVDVPPRRLRRDASTWPATPARSTPSSSSATAAAGPRSADAGPRRDGAGPATPLGSPAAVAPVRGRPPRRRAAGSSSTWPGSPSRRSASGSSSASPPAGAGFSLVEAVAFSTARLRRRLAVRRGGHGGRRLRLGGDRPPHRAPQRAPPPLRGGARPVAARAVRGPSGRRWPTSSPTSRSPSRSSTSGGSGVADRRGYWIAAVAGVVHPLERGDDRRPRRRPGRSPTRRVLGLDVVFPAAMAGLAVGLVTGRREVVALAGAPRSPSRSRSPSTRGSASSAGGLLGPLVGLAVPRRGRAAPRAGRAPGRGRAMSHDPPATTGWRRERRARRPRRPHVRRHVPGAGDPAPGAAASSACRRRSLDYLRLVGPAVLAAIAAVGGALVRRPAGDGPPSPSAPRPLAVLACAADRRLAAQPRRSGSSSRSSSSPSCGPRARLAGPGSGRRPRGRLSRSRKRAPQSIASSARQRPKRPRYGPEVVVEDLPHRAVALDDRDVAARASARRAAGRPAAATSVAIAPSEVQVAVPW